MKKRIVTMLTLAVCLFGFVYHAAAENGSLAKGKSYVDARMWDEAISTLNKVIVADPTNAEAHYLLGYSYDRQGNSFKANERYNSAIALDLKRGKASKALLRMSIPQILATRQVFEDAFVKNPDFKKNIANQIFELGEVRLKDKEFQEAKTLFSMSVSFDNNLSYRACDVFYKRASSTDDGVLTYTSELQNYCGNNKKRMAEVGEKILLIASAAPKGDYRNALKQKALLYLPQERIDQVIPPPSWKIVLERTFEGRGLNDDDWIPIAAAGIDINIGDHLIITGNKFDFFDKGKWQTYQNRMEMTNIIGADGSFGAKAEKGEKFKVEVQRFVEQ
ncbi:MAG: hypothetical protein FD174_3470 [Geobacteraceae bacterium]|nr:MAG: hypothetical protein FD174_3470 [Geobacteraceae bacterium]